MEIKKEASDVNVPSSVARLLSMTNQKARPAIPEQAATPDTKDEKTGEVIKKGLQAIKACPARAGRCFMKISADSEKYMNEIANRMAIEGVTVREGAKIETHHTGVTLVFDGDNQGMIRLAFKKSKGNGDNNSKGAAIVKADKAEKARVKAAKEKEAKAKPAYPKTDSKPDAKLAPKKKLSKKAKAPVKEENDEDWGDE